MSNEIHLAAEAAREASHATTATGGIGTLGINLKIFIAQLVNFTVVLLVMWKWVYKPVVKILDERKDKIEKGVKQAQEVEKRVLDLEKEQKAMIAETKGHAAKIMDDTRVNADERKKVLFEKAKDEVKLVVKQGKAQLQIEKEQMVREARTEIAAIAVEAARKILSDAIDEKKASKLADEVVDKMTDV